MSRRPERGGRPAWESEADIMMEKTEQGLGRLCVIGDPVEHSKSPLIGYTYQNKDTITILYLGKCSF